MQKALATRRRMLIVISDYSIQHLNVHPFIKYTEETLESFDRRILFHLCGSRTLAGRLCFNRDLPKGHMKRNHHYRVQRIKPLVSFSVLQHFTHFLYIYKNLLDIVGPFHAMAEYNGMVNMITKLTKLQTSPCESNKAELRRLIVKAFTLSFNGWSSLFKVDTIVFSTGGRWWPGGVEKA